MKIYDMPANNSAIFTDTMFYIDYKSLNKVYMI